MADVQEVTPAQVMKVYSGRQGCMCGCKGSYYVNPAHRAQAEAKRGYAYDDGDVSQVEVTRVLRLLQADPRTVVEDQMMYVPDRLLGSRERALVAYLA